MVWVDPGPVQNVCYNIHKTNGIVIFLLALVRLGWRWAHPVPLLPADMPEWQAKLARTTHALLYLVLFLMPITGFRGDPEARGRRVPHRLSGQPHPRGSPRAPTSGRSSCARSGSACTWRTPCRGSPRGEKIGVFACSTGPAPRTRSAASPRPTATPCRSWSCRWAIRAASRTSAELQLGAQLRSTSPSPPSRSPWRRGAERPAARVHPGAERPRRARCWSRSRSTCSTRRCRSRSTTARDPAAHRPDPAAVGARRRLAGPGAR